MLLLKQSRLGIGILQFPLQALSRIPVLLDALLQPIQPSFQLLWGEHTGSIHGVQHEALQPVPLPKVLVQLRFGASQSASGLLRIAFHLAIHHCLYVHCSGFLEDLSKQGVDYPVHLFRPIGGRAVALVFMLANVTSVLTSFEQLQCLQHTSVILRFLLLRHPRLAFRCLNGNRNRPQLRANYLLDSLHQLITPGAIQIENIMAQSQNLWDLGLRS